MTCFVVIAAYQEAATIGAIVAQSAAQDQIAGVIVVDDGSTDQTAALAAANGAQILRHEINQGKGKSLAWGLAEALAHGPQAIITLDGDGQHRPCDIAELIARARTNPDAIIIGSRRASKANAPFARYAANRVADFFISWAAGTPIDDSQSGLRLYPAAALRRIAADPPTDPGFAYETELLIAAARLGFAIEAVPIPAIHGPALRPSHFRPITDTWHITCAVGLKLLVRLRLASIQPPAQLTPRRH